MKKDDLLKAVKQAILQQAIEGKLTADWREQNQPLSPAKWDSSPYQGEQFIGGSKNEQVRNNYQGEELNENWDARVLLEKIKAEKEKLIKEKKIRKEKPLPPITEEEIPFELPESWVWCRLGEIGITQTGTTPPKNDNSYYGDYIPFIQPSNITDIGLNFDCIYLSKKGIEKSRFIPKYSNLMVCIGGSAGKTCYNEIDVTCNQQINTITGLSDINYKFLDIILKSPHFYNLVWDTIKQGSTPILNKGNWSKILVPICSLAEQKAIVEKVEALMQQLEMVDRGESIDNSPIIHPQVRKLIELYDKINRTINEITTQKKLVKQLKQSILQEAIQGKLTTDWREQNPNTEPASELLKRIKVEKEKLIKEKKIRKGKKQKSLDLGDIQPTIPNTWLYVDLDDISQFITDGTHQTPKYTSKGKIFLSAQNVKPFKFMPDNHKYISEKAFEEYTKGKKAEIGDLLIGRVGSKGETAVIDRDIEFAFYVSLGFVKTFKEFTDSNYLAIVLNSPYGNKYATGNMSSIGASAGNFNLGRIRSFSTPLPPLAEQKAIVEKVENLMQKVSAMEEEINKSEQNAQMLMQAVLKEAFEGKKEEVEV